MIKLRMFLFMKNLLSFLVYRLYREWKYIFKNGQSYSEKASEQGDLYVRQLIENIIHDRARKYDPYLVDETAAIVWGRTSVILKKSCLTGLNTLHRTNICSLTEVEKKLFVNTNLGAGPLSYRRQIILKFGSFERKVVALISILDLKVSVDFSVEKETGRNGSLLNVAINELKSFNLSLNGFGYFDVIINWFLRLGMLALARIVRNLLENKLEQYILVRLPKYQFPVEGILKKKTEFNISDDRVDENEQSEAFCMEQNDKKHHSRLFPIGGTSLHDKSNLTENSSVKDLGSNINTTETCKSFLQDNKWNTKMKSFYEPSPVGLSSVKILSTEDFKSPAENKCNPFTLLSRETLEISRSLNRIKEKLRLVSEIHKSWSRRINTSKRLKTLEDECPLFDWKFQDKLNVSEIESVIENMNIAISSPSKSFINGQTFPLSEEKVKTETESEVEDSFQVLEDSNRHPVKDSKNAIGIVKHSRTMEEILKIHELYTKIVNGEASEIETKLPIRFQSSFVPSKNIKCSKLDGNITELETGSPKTESETLVGLNETFGSKMIKAQTVQDEKMFIEEVSDDQKEATKDLSKTKLVSSENFKHSQDLESEFSALNVDLYSSGREMFQNNLLNSTTVDGSENMNVSSNVSQENFSRSEDSETKRITEMLSENQGVESKTRYSSNPNDGINRRIVFEQNKINSMKVKMNDEKTFDSEENENVSKSIKLRKNNDARHEQFPLKHVKIHIENKFSKDSMPTVDDNQTADVSSSSEELNISCNEDLIENNLLENIMNSLNDRGVECLDSMVEFSSIAALKLNPGSNKTKLAKTPELKTLHDLQEKIIAKIRNLKSDVSESDTEYKKCLNNFPIPN